MIRDALNTKLAIRRRLRESIDWRTTSEAVIGIQVGVIVDAYIDHWFAADAERFETRGVESEIVSPLRNPETGAASPLWRHASKLDGLAFDRWESVEKVIEHKTTTDGLEDWSPYWRKLRIDSQVSKYLLSLRQSGRETISSILYDVVKKPTTKPKQVVKAEVRKMAESGFYHGFQVSEREIARVRDVYENAKGKSGGFTGNLTESFELYGLRLRRLIRDDRDGTFQRRTIVRTDEELEEYARELWQLAAELRVSRKSGVHPKNSTNCSAFGRLCEFFSLCVGENDENSDRFERPAFVHSELESEAVREKAKDGGRNILTNSRLTMFQSCRQREFLRYGVGLREAGKTDSVALNWGRLFHDLMEIVWHSYSNETERET